MLPEGWTLRRAEVGTPDAPFYGYMAQYVDERGYPALLLYVSYPDRRPDYRWVTSASNSTSTYEVRTVDGHAALVRYSPPGPLHNRYKATKVQIFNATTGIDYWLLGQHQSLSGANVDATIEIARSLFESPNPLPPPTTFRYDTYDTTGAGAEPGSYAFLADPADTTSAVTTYEGLRDGTTTALRIHQTDADGVSRAAFLDTVEAGDLFEWRQAEDCWVRYRVTELLPDPSGKPRKLLGVEWMTYAATGCTGAIAADAAARVGLNPPPFTSDGIAAPVRHGPYLLHPVPWDGDLEEKSRPSYGAAQGQDATEHVVSSDLAVVRAHPFWREPDLPDGWTLHMATVGLEGIDGYWALYLDARGGIGAEIWVTRPPLLPKYIRATDGVSIYEARTIDGHPAIVRYSPADDPTHRTSAAIFHEATGIEYLVVGISPRASGLPDIVIAAARSLYRPQTTFRYGTYDTTGEVAEPGSYAFLADPADTRSVVTTYEGLRDGTTTALRIHETDADGVSRAALLDTVEVGDRFEWREAEDCFVRYRVIGVEAGSDTRDFAIKSYSHTYTGCSGAIGGSGGVDAQSGRSTSGTATTSQFIWAPVTLKTGAFTAPTWHGPSLVIPKNWAGPVPATAVFTGPSISWPPSPLPAPNLGTGWSGSLGRGYPDTELEGIYSHTDGGHRSSTSSNLAGGRSPPTV